LDVIALTVEVVEGDDEVLVTLDDTRGDEFCCIGEARAVDVISCLVRRVACLRAERSGH
jgi:hypothetical protein